MYMHRKFSQLLCTGHSDVYLYTGQTIHTMTTAQDISIRSGRD